MIKCLLILLTASLAGCGQPKQKLNIFIWSEYLDPKVVADFEKRFDCKVTVDLYEDPDSMIAKLAAGGTSIYDVVVPSNTTLPAMVKRGLLSILRRENIPNLRNIDSRFLALPFDPGNQYGVPYQWGTSGLYIRKSKGKPIEETWGLIFDAAKQPGPFMLIEDMRTCFGAALRYKGHGLNSTDPKELVEARDLLIQAKKRSLGFEGTIGNRNRVLAKGATLAMVYNNDAMSGVREDAETYYFIPREGGEVWLDSLSIPAKAPHRDLAEKFINYILDPKVGAQVSNFTRTATPNKAALEFVDPADRKDPNIYPPPEVMSRLEYSNDLGEKNKLYDELWTQIKAK
jgi:spermidine/putrescine transport system substrate-binding protein